MNAPRVGVIGGGLAGIAAALALSDAGATVTLFERRPHLGGLTSSIERDGLSFDNGQHVFLGCCSSYRALLGRIGASHQVYLQPRLDVPVLSPDGRHASIRRTRLPAPLHLAASLLCYRFLSLRERIGLLRAVVALRRLNPADPALDSETFGSWLARHGQSPRAIERLWNLIIQPTVNVSAAEASLALAAQVFRIGFLEHADGADMGWSTVPLVQLHGENALRALEESGVTVLTNTSVTSIVRSSSGTFSVLATEDPFIFDALIVSTAPRVAATLGALPGDEDLATKLGTSPIVNIHFVLDRKVTDLPMAACVDSPIEFFFDRTDASGVTSGQCLVVSLSAADKYAAVGSSELVPMFFEALGDLFPAARDAVLTTSVVTREHAATFRGAPGIESVRPPNATSTPGLYLAGAWCHTGWPATMEGAVRSGNDAAAQVLSLFSDSSNTDPRNRERVRT
ncbi:MAG TPA: hydroxysqualene dehydroxylase HpnE [Acidimicrobiales bacterium]|jgi:squalene-associated FAD-dependent desaturase|nr:hydroxysqualene dehydroxylase HpnE [Acidimicrobiales bacterium]